MAKRKIDIADGMRAVEAVRAGETSRPTVATAVRFLLEELATLAPGSTVEMRVPPFGATQCIAGPRHTRGTPPNVIETDPHTWVALAVGDVSWEEARDTARLTASGARADVSMLLPLIRLR